MTPLDDKIRALQVQIKTNKRIARQAALASIAPLERELRTLQAYKRRNPDALAPPVKKVPFRPRVPTSPFDE